MATSPNGIDIIRKSLASMPDSPGVYRMLDQDGQVLYVGKARQLRKRVVAYTHLEKLPARLQRMVMMTAGMDITVTHTEGEALLLEANLIKEFKPRYNILLRDDKSFPYITITTSHDFPRITKHRGAKKKDDIYFGPFPSVGAVNQSITLLQKAFLLRNCTDSDFSNRPRPCIEYQIKRCSAPCVHKISQQEYQELVQQTKDFLEGKNALVHTTLAKRMEQASNEMEYEKAAIYRDRIQALAAIQAQQAVYIPGMKDADVLAIAHNPGAACIKVLFIRGGQLLGDKSFFPIQIEDYNTADILEAFISKFYQSVPAPASLILSEDIPGRLLLEQALTDLNNRKVTITLPQRGKKLSLVELAITNTREALEYKESSQKTEKEYLEKLAALLAIPSPIRRIEVFDNSHLFGQHAVGAMIVATPDGFNKNSYRKFNVDPGNKATGGDDYNMLKQVLIRRYSKIKQQSEAGDAPDLVLIDGGQAHLSVAEKIFDSLKLTIPLLCIAKGLDRNAGNETFFCQNQAPFTLPPHDPVLYYLQRLRDEAHRFAIDGYRKKHKKALHQSALDGIPSIGPKRKRLLLNHFGSISGIEEASIEELLKVETIHKNIAKIIYDYFHN